MHHIDKRDDREQNRRHMFHFGANLMFQKRRSYFTEWQVHQLEPRPAVQELNSSSYIEREAHN